MYLLSKRTNQMFQVGFKWAFFAALSNFVQLFTTASFLGLFGHHQVKDSELNISIISSSQVLLWGSWQFIQFHSVLNLLCLDLQVLDPIKARESHHLPFLWCWGSLWEQNDARFQLPVSSSWNNCQTDLKFSLAHSTTQLNKHVAQDQNAVAGLILCFFLDLQYFQFLWFPLVWLLFTVSHCVMNWMVTFRWKLRAELREEILAALKLWGACSFRVH